MVISRDSGFPFPFLSDLFLHVLFGERERDYYEVYAICTRPLLASINKTSASHFIPVRARTIWLVAAQPFVYLSHLLLLPFPITLPPHSSGVAHLHLFLSVGERHYCEKYALLTVRRLSVIF